MSEPTPPRKRNGRRESINLPPSMALLFNELQCPVCLDMLSNPVTTPCGHNFCQTCLKQCWDNSEECKCPYCKEHFSQKPDLKINTVFKETVQLLKENSTALSSASSPMSEELQCAICLDVFNDPVSTPCGHNFCKTCLEKCWDIFENCNCPICKQTFSKRPDLKSNTALRKIGQIFEKITGYKRETKMTEYSPPLESKAQEETLDKPSFMGSSSSVLSENRQCSICLEVSTDPVTTPCGHNFCKTCLEECWENCQDHRCPCCKEIFGERPDLRVFVQLQSHSEILMSCSYKEPKQESHHRVLNIKKVKMIDLVEDLENYICEKHESLQEHLCRDDQISVCLFCTEEDHKTHKTHNTVLIEKESRDMKAQLTKTQERVLQMIQDTLKKIQEIQHSKIRKMPFPERLLHLQDVICHAVMESKNASPVLKGGKNCLASSFNNTLLNL